MVANFSFGGEDYENSGELWHSVLLDLVIPITEIRVLPILSDHSSTITILRENGIGPGIKGRRYVCHCLLQRMLRLLTGHESFEFDDWLQQERELRERTIRRGHRCWKKHQDKPPHFLWETFGILPGELEELQ
jgi:hypothetical protein